MKLFSKNIDTKLVKTLVYPIFTVLIGLFCGTMVVELTDGSQLNWSNIFHTISFYVLIAIILIYVFFTRDFYKQELLVDKFKNAEHGLAYSKSKILPALADLYAKEVRDGNLDKTIVIDDQLRKWIDYK